MYKLSDVKIAVIGLGYVGLPLAVAFAKRFCVLGFDIDSTRVKELETGLDSTHEILNSELVAAKTLSFSCCESDLKSCNTFIVTVPTPIDKFKRPDLSPLLKVSAMLGRIIKKNDVIIYESTVYPGATEDDCIPVVERQSGLNLNKDFFAGYSPERINPGDKNHRVEDIVKVTSMKPMPPCTCTASEVKTSERSVIQPLIIGISRFARSCQKPPSSPAPPCARSSAPPPTSSNARIASISAFIVVINRKTSG